MTEPSRPDGSSDQPWPAGPGPPGAQPLSYAAADLGADRFYIAQCIVAAAVSAALVVGSGFAMLFLGGIGIFAGPVAVAVLLITAALRLRRIPRRRGLAAGIWIGIGLAVLLEGVCWFGLSGMRIGG